MKLTTTIVLIFSITLINAQEIDVEKSHRIEIEGWESFFDGAKSLASEKFQKSLDLNPDNLLAKIGLFNATPEKELNVETFELINDFPPEKNKSHSLSDISSWMLMNGLVEKQMSDSLISLRNKYDENYIWLKAALTDSRFEIKDDNGNIRQEGFFNDRKPSGIWKFYGYEENVVHRSYTYPVQGDTVIAKYFKPNGDIIRQEILIGSPFSRNTSKLKEIIFWQENPGRKPEYLFVSKTGFVKYENGKAVELNENTPDNIIGRKWDLDKKQLVAYIWKNGRKEPYELCEDDGMVISETIGNIRKTYRWNNCKKTLLEAKTLEK